MIITKISCDNMFMFKDFTLDFTYNRQIKHELAKDDELFPGSRIKVRKNLVIMGSNAAGKTTFGKLMCFALNFIYRGRVGNKGFNLAEIPFDKSKPSSFSVEFYIDGTAYLLEVDFKGTKLLLESLKKCPVYKTYNIAKLREALKYGKAVSVYLNTGEPSPEDDILGSRFFFYNASDEATFIKKNIRYYFDTSSFNNLSGVNVKATDVATLDSLLPEIDDSVAGVKSLEIDGDETDSYRINFKNGDYMTVPDGNLARCKDRLSHGTFEAIGFLNRLMYMRATYGGLVFVDEKLAHVHSELEAYLLRTAFAVKPRNSQLFFTTHNIEIFQVDVPMNAFIFFKRNDEGFNEAVCPSDYINKNDRNLSSYYEKNYFGIKPRYNMMDKFLGKNKA